MFNLTMIKSNNYFPRIIKEICNELDISYELTYSEIKHILGFEIDHSFLTYKKELKEYGYEVDKIRLKDKKIIFNKIVDK